VRKRLAVENDPDSSYYCNRLKELDKKEKGQKPTSCHPQSYDTTGGNMKKYRHLSFEDRIYIEVWRWERKSLKYIASRLRKHPSTISRELKRGKTGWLAIGYKADLGEQRCKLLALKKGRRAKLIGDLAKLVIELIRRDWSPEQISGRLKLENRAQISHEAIYQLVKADKENGGTLYLHLRHGRRRRKKRFYVPRVRADILNRRHISERPKVINERKRHGDWERDLMFGDSRSSALLTFVERKTLLTVLRKVESKSPMEIADKTVEAMSTLNCKSITNDNGFEFRHHLEESLALNIPIYFTNPYSSWEKGTCENTNGLVRQYFPHQQSMKELNNERVKFIEQMLNSRPRKKLGFQTPLEASTQMAIRSL
jgi:IS30 family transposase